MMRDDIDPDKTAPTVGPPQIGPVFEPVVRLGRQVGWRTLWGIALLTAVWNRCAHRKRAAGE